MTCCWCWMGRFCWAKSESAVARADSCEPRQRMSGASSSEVFFGGSDRIRTERDGTTGRRRRRRRDSAATRRRRRRYLFKSRSKVFPRGTTGAFIAAFRRGRRRHELLFEGLPWGRRGVETAHKGRRTRKWLIRNPPSEDARVVLLGSWQTFMGCGFGPDHPSTCVCRPASKPNRNVQDRLALPSATCGPFLGASTGRRAREFTRSATFNGMRSKVTTTGTGGSLLAWLVVPSFFDEDWPRESGSCKLVEIRVHHGERRAPSCDYGRLTADCGSGRFLRHPTVVRGSHASGHDVEKCAVRVSRMVLRSSVEETGRSFLFVPKTEAAQCPFDGICLQERTTFQAHVWRVLGPPRTHTSPPGGELQLVRALVNDVRESKLHGLIRSYERIARQPDPSYSRHATLCKIYLHKEAFLRSS